MKQEDIEEFFEFVLSTYNEFVLRSNLAARGADAGAAGRCSDLPPATA